MLTDKEHKGMNKDEFLYDVFMTSNTRTTRDNTPIELYHAYLDDPPHNDMDAFYELGAQITTFVTSCRLPGIEPEFAKKEVWWYLGNEKLFGISLYSVKPYLTFCCVDERMLKEIYPEYPFRPTTQFSQWICQKNEVTVGNLIELYEIRVHDFLSEHLHYSPDTSNETKN